MSWEQAWFALIVQVLLGLGTIAVAWRVGVRAANSSLRAAFGERLKLAIELATSASPTDREIGVFLLEHLATPEIATEVEADTVRAILTALSAGTFEGDELDQAIDIQNAERERGPGLGAWLAALFRRNRG